MKTPAEGTQIPIDTATKAQLRAFANHLGCKVTNFDSEAQLREKIAATGYGEAHIIAFSSSPVKAAEARAVAAGDAVAEPMAVITVHTQEGSGGKRPVFVGVNGKAILIPRAKQVPVKIRYVEALRNATETKYEYDEEAKANMPRELPSYPFEVHEMPPKAEIMAWRAYEAAEEARLAAIDKANSQKAA